MAKDTKTNAKSEPAAESKEPIYIAYTVTKVGRDKSYWSRIGAMFPHKDGQGFNLNLEALPVDGKVVLRTRGAGDEAEGTDEGAGA
jgi:hypothetical protein